MSLLRTLAGTVVGKAARDKTAGRGLIAMGVGIVATRIATRSVPGALLVGAGIVAKALWDRQREQDDEVETVADKIENSPDIIEGIAREKPEMLTDEHDDIDLEAEIDVQRKMPEDAA